MIDPGIFCDKTKEIFQCHERLKIYKSDAIANYSIMLFGSAHFIAIGYYQTRITLQSN